MLLTGEAAVGADPANRRDDGFSLADARLMMRGFLEGGFNYFVQGNLIKTPALLDREIGWRQESWGFSARSGYFRVPVSGELQIPAPVLDLIDRSQIVDAVVPGRQVGLELSQEILGKKLLVRAGAFNGNGLDTNDDNRLLYTLRFEGAVPLGTPRSIPGDIGNSGNPGGAGSPESDTPWKLHYGFSGAYSKDRDARLGLDFPNKFQGTRALGGADLRVSRDRFFVAAEALYASIDFRTRSRRNVYGGQFTVGWDVTDLVQVLARYDGLSAGSLTSDLDLAIASLVLNFTKHISLQTDLRVPTRGADPTPGGVVNLNVIF